MLRRSKMAIIIILLIILNLIIIYTPENRTRGTNVFGPQDGIWDVTGSPYIVTDYINVTASGYLLIQPGVEIRFDIDAVFEIWGELKAVGTKSSPIRFTSNLASPYPGSWGALLIEYTGIADLQNCTISYAQNGINATANTKLRLKNCEIYKCVNGTNFDTVSVSSLENCKIHDNLNNGFRSKYGMGLIRVMNNTIYNNKYAIIFEYTGLSTIYNNTIYNNSYGIKLEYIMQCSVVKNSIKDTNVPPPFGSGEEINQYGIRLYRGRTNDISKNKIINTEDNALEIISSYNITLINNVIENATGLGIYLKGSIYNFIINNSITYVNKSSIVLKSTSNDNLFRNNTIKKFDEQYGVEFDNLSIWNWFDTDNLVNNVPLRIYYQTLGSRITAELSGIWVVEPLLTNLGQVMIIESSDFNIKHSTFMSGNAGIFLYDSHNIILENLTIFDATDYAVNFGYNCTGVKLVNTTVSIPVFADGYFRLGEYANISILNTSFDQSRVIYSPASNLTIQWYLHVRVFTSLNKIPIQGAKVHVYNRFGEMVYNGTTSKFGTARYIICTQKKVNDLKKIGFNNHNVTVFKLHYQLGYAGSGVLIDRSKWATVEMLDNHKPSLDGVISPEITHNRTPTLTWERGFDLDNDRLLYCVNLWNQNQPGIIIDANSTYKNKYIVKNNLTYGERYSVNVTASDGFGGWSNTIYGSFYLSNRQPSKPEIQITPQQTQKRPSKNEDLVCTVITESVDLDDNPKDIIKYNFLWYKNGVLQANMSVWNFTKTSHVLDKKYTLTGEIWTCNVTATDGFDFSQSSFDSRTIKNSIPKINKTVPVVSVYEDTIDMSSINLMEIFIDEDNDPLSFNYSLKGDNISIQIFQNNGTVIIKPKPNWNSEKGEIVDFSASDDEKTVVVNIKIKVLAVPDPPTARILLPKNDKKFIYNLTVVRGINFLGEAEDPDLDYGDTINLTWKSNVSGILGYGLQLEKIILPVGDHKIEFIVQDLDDNSASDSIIIHIISLNESDTDTIIPEVGLLAPLPNSMIKSTTIKLSWEMLNLNSTEAERVLFDVYLGTSKMPFNNLVATEYIGNTITISDLEPNTTYYWSIIPYIDNYQGICVDFVWNFTVNLAFKPVYGIELSMSENEILLQAGKQKIINFTIKNTGNNVDKFLISLEFSNYDGLLKYTELEVDKIALQAQQSTKINITFNLPKNVTGKNLKLKIHAFSIEGLISTNISRNLTIIGHEKFADEDKSDFEMPPGFLNILFLLLIILILILLILMIFITAFYLWIKQQSKRGIHYELPKTLQKLGFKKPKSKQVKFEEVE